MKNAIRIVLAALASAVIAQAGVTISSPASGTVTGSPVHFVASASSSSPITVLRIYVDSMSAYSVSSNKLDTLVPMALGAHNVTVQAWDSTGAVFKSSETVTVKGATTGSVTVSSPANGSTVSSPIPVIASANAPHAIKTMQVFLDNKSVFTVNAASLNTSIAASTGAHTLMVQAADSTGATYRQSLVVTVSGTPSNASTKTQIQTMPSWGSCTVCAGIGGNGPVAIYSMAQNQSSPSLSGKSAKFSISGPTPYADAIWYKDLGVANSAKNLKYDLDFYLTTPQFAQSLEFDSNQNTGVRQFIYGTQCNVKHGGVWDVWDTAVGTWRHTTVPCAAPTAYKWHHLTWEFTRTDSQITFIALTYDGVKHYINQTYSSRASKSQKINVAFQMDGDSAQHPYSVWLDNVTLSYW
ncbi:MAG TPA: Ig-like domain-containing protein [Candidatus Angelobacter sp.]|nr:Ig-like domain-containing protein [Candidatus Angelobacter sp.]